MDELAGATVGTQGNGLNQEQRKRLTIGVELASKPELLMFLDEVSHQQVHCGQRPHSNNIAANFRS